jgi:gluconate kinase
MNNLDRTRWLLKVRDALAEQDKARRNSMLLAADGLLKRNNQSLALLRDRRGQVVAEEGESKSVRPA